MTNLLCQCNSCLPRKKLKCPLCRAPAAWCSLNCSHQHLISCGQARADVADSVRIMLWNEDSLGGPRCLNCGGNQATQQWRRCRLCYDFKWCSAECQQANLSKHISECVEGSLDQISMSLALADKSTKEYEKRHPGESNRGSQTNGDDEVLDLLAEDVGLVSENVLRGR
jgi:hypothetical protein